MNKCPICKKSYADNPACGLRLFNSENECAICLEKKPVMLALPCGHQFCQEDLQKIGIRPIPPVRRPPVRQPPVRQPPVRQPRVRPAQRHRRRSRPSSARIPRLPIISLIRPTRLPVIVDVRTSRRRAQKRCGWCGHLGHTIRKCFEHRFQCNCSTLKTRRHKEMYKRKHRCQICRKKGHQAITCLSIVHSS